MSKITDENLGGEQTTPAAGNKKKVIIISAILIMAIAIVIATTIVITQIVIPNRNLAAIKNSSVGDTVKFGDYNGNSEWVVLEREENRVLIISKNVVEMGRYNEEAEEVTWETCTLRKWLNETYIKHAFSKAESEAILTTNVINLANSTYGTNGGNDTSDKIFLLSIDEANLYFSSDDSRIAKTNLGMESIWWLRSPGGLTRCAARVWDGIVGDNGIYVNHNGGIRPAMWVDVSKL